ncbi:hypothetical protein [Arthrobacter sp. SAFR-044]
MAKYLMSFPCGDGTVSGGTYRQTAVACRCAQELRVFEYDPAG